MSTQRKINNESQQNDAIYDRRRRKERGIEPASAAETAVRVLVYLVVPTGTAFLMYHFIPVIAHQLYQLARRLHDVL
jgi:hypothetical protein